MESKKSRIFKSCNGTRQNYNEEGKGESIFGMACFQGCQGYPKVSEACQLLLMVYKELF